MKESLILIQTLKNLRELLQTFLILIWARLGLHKKLGYCQHLESCSLFRLTEFPMDSFWPLQYCYDSLKLFLKLIQYHLHFSELSTLSTLTNKIILLESDNIEFIEV